MLVESKSQVGGMGGINVKHEDVLRFDFQAQVYFSIPNAISFITPLKMNGKTLLLGDIGHFLI